MIAALLLLSAAPVFAGFEDARYQDCDRTLVTLVADFNGNKAKWAGSTPRQTTFIDDLCVAQLKSQMIQETGGKDLRSRTAWKCDPLQINDPRDWSPYKKYLGLRKPRRRNEGTRERNLRAAMMLLVRKGFGVSGQPAANRADAHFDGWDEALRRYNGRSDRIPDGRTYREFYAQKILERARNPSVKVPIERTP